MNVRAVLLTIHYFLPDLRDGGRIINLSSGVIRIAAPDSIAYAASKGAVDTLTRTLAADLGARGITVNAVAPGITDTDMNTAWLLTRLPSAAPLTPPSSAASRSPTTSPTSSHSSPASRPAGLRAPGSTPPVAPGFNLARGPE